MPLKKRDHYWVYMVRCKNGTLYTGYTNDLEHRLRMHNEGKGAKYLRGKAPVTLVWSKAYRNFRCAVRKEHEIKRLNRVQKEEIIEDYG